MITGPFPPPSHRECMKGFNLIEAAVVLGVIGLVIGGIWIAATSVTQSQRINHTAAGILQIAANARRIFSHSDYPTSSGSTTNVTSTAAAANIFPTDFKYTSGVWATSPVGAKLYVGLSCWSVCPQLMVAFLGPSTPPDQGGITSAECIQLIRRFAGPAKDRSDLSYIQVHTVSNPSFLLLYPPFDPTSVSCPSDTTQVDFRFNP